MTNDEIARRVNTRRGLLWDLYEYEKAVKRIKGVLELYPKLEGYQDPVFGHFDTETCSHE